MKDVLRQEPAIASSQKNNIQKQLDAALQTIAQLSKACIAEEPAIASSQENNIQKQLDAALQTIAQLSKEACMVEEHASEEEDFNESFDGAEHSIEDEQVVQAVIVPSTDELVDPLLPNDFGSNVAPPTDIAVGILVAEGLPVETEDAAEVCPITGISDPCGSSLASLSSTVAHDDDDEPTTSLNIDIIGPDLCPQPTYISVTSVCHSPIVLDIQQTEKKKRKRFCVDVCSKAIGYPPTRLNSSERRKLIFSFNDPSKVALVVVSKNSNTPSKLLQKLRTTPFKEAFIILGPAKPSMAGKGKAVHMLGEYSPTTPLAPSILQKSDYELLPELTKNFILKSAKSVRGDIQTLQQLAESLGKSDGIAVHKVELKAIRSRDALEKLVAEEARQRGVLLSSAL
ncbi:hypothetical protein BT96DRAFT_1009750 [Gymnopus androsaceus JB14]|uniref:Uncharacterized protein n=1 Tax=Gymnopus androsaceus JB14 TaxID=1447944 RepID=A0A6A4GBW9_9AGAR|nr:hypothetical protein BT96DRAFT_1009750 [Gymnopus androsaceus JB14]